MNDLKVWTDDCDFVIAERASDVGALMCAHYGEGYAPDPDEEWEERDPGKAFTFYPEGDRSGPSITKTFGEWAAERGQGYFCCTEF